MKSIQILLFFFILSILLTSCNGKLSVTFIVKNEGNSRLDSLTIDPTANNQYISVRPGEEIQFELDMTDIPGTDGAYEVSWQNANKQERTKHTFGYYTNGMPLEDNTRITIQQDTVIFEYKQ